MADTTNHVYITNISDNSDLDPEKANDTLDQWEDKTERITGSNVRDEALDSFALGPLRSTYVVRGGTNPYRSAHGDYATYTDRSERHYWTGWQGHRGPDNRLAPIQENDGADDAWQVINMGWSGLEENGTAGYPALSGTSEHARITFPLHDDKEFGTFNNMNRWIIYCSCEVMIQRPRAMVKDKPSAVTKCPQAELALRWSGLGHDWTTINETRRGFGIGNPVNWMCGPDGKGTIPTSLSYSVVHKFDPLPANNTKDAQSGDPATVKLYWRWVDARDFNANDYKNRFWFAAMNINLFAVNYRR